MNNSWSRDTIYHLRELAFCGYSNSGKTTLLEKLVTHLATHHRVGCAKHDAHRFELDRPGKDTHRLAEAGAHAIHIHDSNHHALISQGSSSPDSSRFSLCDFVLVEGHKSSPMEKVLVLDQSQGVPSGLENLQGVVATVSPQPSGPLNLPHFHRDDIPALASWILGRWSPPPLHGLVLMGGRSERMGRDKSQMLVEGRSQLDRTLNLLQEQGLSTYISGRSDQMGSLANFIPDRLLDFGPLGGIVSALMAHPQHAFLVAAVDMPLLSSSALQQLISARNPFKVATAFHLKERLHPDPLLAIYEPESKATLFSALSRNLQSPSQILSGARIQSLHCDNPKALSNANTPQDLEHILHTATP